MTPGFAKSRQELPWLPYRKEGDVFLINSHNFGITSSLLTGLVSYWNLNETSGDAADSFSTNTLTANNAPGATAGKLGNARTFNGSNQSFSRNSNASLQVGAGSFTLTAWVQLANRADRAIAGKWQPTGNDREYLLRFGNAANRYGFLISNNGIASSEAIANNFGVPPLNTWTLVIAWHDATAQTLNIRVDNGATNSISYTAGGRSGNAEFRLGALANAAQFWNGNIDDVGLWNRVLTSDEQATIWNSGNGITYPFA